MSVEIVVDLALVSAKTPLVALADVKLRWPDSEVTIRRCPVFRKSGPPWTNLPKIPIEKNGKRHFAPLIELSRDLRNAVSNAVLNEYQRKQSSGHTSSPGVSDQSASNLMGLRTGDGEREETPGGPNSRDRRKKPAEKLRMLRSAAEGGTT